MKGVIYARYSAGANQTEQSIEGQLRECYEYAKKHDITIVDTYIDRKMSGTNDQREQFQQMIKDSEKCTFEAIIVYKIDRFTRNRYDSAIYKARLKKNGVKVLYAKESIPDGPEGIILESLLEGMAEYYSAELSQKIRRGINESILKCHATGGNPALGYDIAPDKTFTINEAGAAIVQKIFNMYDAGNTVTQICEELNSLDIKTSRNAKYNKNSLRTILQNEKYIGIYKCKDVRVVGGMPAIVEKELFARVQGRIASNRAAPAKRKAKVDYLLSGKLYCGKCGIGMVGESGTGKHGETHNYYICANKKRLKSCDKKTVRKDWLENLVVSETVKNVLAPEQMKKLARRCVEVQMNTDSQHLELDMLKNKLTETKKSIGNLMSAIEQGIITKNTKDRLVELEQAQEKLEFQIELQKIKRPQLTEKQVAFMLSSFQRDTDTPLEEYNRNVIECFISSVHLYDDKLYISYNLSNNSAKLLSSEIELIVNGDKASSHCVWNSSDLDSSSPPSVKARKRWVNPVFTGFLLSFFVYFLS